MAQQAAICAQAHPPTAVTHCASAWLTRSQPHAGASGSAHGSASAAGGLPDLVVVRSTQLEVFSVKRLAGPPTAGAAADNDDAAVAGGGPAGAATGLELLSSGRLFGVVESVAVLRGRGPGQRDALLLTFRDAKLSVLHWDSARHELAPSSLHYFEGDASLKQGRVAFPFPPLAVTDPQGRCAAVLMFRHQLAVLPAVDSELLALGISGDLDSAAGGAGQGPVGGGAGVAAAAAVGNSYVDNLGKAGIKEVRDAVFLHGYNEPVLALLHEPEPTWGANLRLKHDTCALTALSLNLTRKQHPKIWGATELPSDACRLSAAPCGGVLVLCQHLVLYYRQGQQAGVVLHPYALPPKAALPPLQLFDPRAAAEAGGPGAVAARYAQEHAVDVQPETVPSAARFCDGSQAAELKATADGACVCWLAPDSALLCLRSGQLLQLAVVPEPGGGGARRLAVGRAGAAPQPSCCTTLSEHGSLVGPSAATQQGQHRSALFFLGSAAGDSLLINAASAAKLAAAAKRPAEGEDAAAFDRQESKRLRLESVEAVGSVGAAGDAEQQHREQRGAADAASGASPEQGQQGQDEGQQGPADYDSEDEEAMIYGTALIAPAAAAPPAGGAAAPAAGAATGGGGAAAGPAVAATQLQRYQLQVLDSLANIGPLRDFTIAESASAAGGASEAPPCLVACSGEGKGGTLTVLRRSVVPDVITEVPLPGLLGAWAVHHRPAAEADGEHQGPQRHHAYLLLSFQGATKVLATGDELREVTETVEFAVDTPTLAAGAVCGGRRIVQVFPQGVRLLDGEEAVQDIWAAELVASSAGATQEALGGGASIVAADIQEPYVALQLSDGSAAVLVAHSDSCRLAPLHQAGSEAGPAGALRPGTDADKITSCSLHLDACGWLQQLTDSAATNAASGAMFCLLGRASGACQLYALPTMQPVFECAGLAEGPQLLTAGTASAAPAVEALEDGDEAALVVEARLVSFGPAAAGRTDPAASRASPAAACEAPMLLALTADHQLLAYKAFAGPAPGGVGGELRFRRVPLGVPPLLPPAVGAAAAGQTWHLPRLHRFEGMGEGTPFSGVFVAGLHPHWLFAFRGTLVPHPHFLPAPAAPGQPPLASAGFTPFHNVNCPHGFILATCGSRSAIQISQLPPRTRLDAPWPRQRIAVKGTPLKVAHYAEADLFAVLTSRQVPFRAFLPEEEEPGDPQASYSYALAEAAARARGVMQGHEARRGGGGAVRLVSPAGGWQATWRHELLPGEKALAVAAVRLKDHSSGATVPLLAVGAALPAGEDYPCGGRLLLFEVTKQAAADGGPAAAGAASQWGARLIYTREFKGPVTALAGLEGYLLLASGNRIETCSLSSTTITSTADDGTISAATTWRVQRSAFYDGPTLLTSLNVVKNFVLLGDVAHSVQFVRYKDEGRQLSLLSKDFNRTAVGATQFIINGSSLHLASGDAAGTLRLLSYLPNHPESWKGQRLVAWGAFHTGEAATAMQRLRLHAPGDGDHTTRQGVLLSTAAGTLATLSPLALAPGTGLDAAPAVAALRALQRELLLLLPQAAGLNPAAFRRRYAAIPPGLQGGCCFSKPLALEDQGVLDGDLLAQYVLLPRRQQEGAAEAAGLGRDQLLELLQGIWRAAGTLL